MEHNCGTCSNYDMIGYYCKKNKLNECISTNYDCWEPSETERERCLNQAIKCVCGHRETDYGKPEDNFATIASLWSAYCGGYEFSAMDVAMMMALLKIARIRAGTATEDSFVDLAGYAACGAEISAKQHE